MAKQTRARYPNRPIGDAAKTCVECLLELGAANLHHVLTMADNKKTESTEADYDYAVKRLVDSVEKNGFGTISFRDGRLLMFKRSAIQKILDDNKSHEQIILFLQEEVKN